MQLQPRLHFALPLRLQAGLPQWVASCDRRWLAMAVQGLEAAGQPLARVVPEWGPPAAPWRLHVDGPVEAPQAVVCSDKGVSLVPWDAQAQAWLLPAGTENAAGVTPAARDALPAWPEVSADPSMQALVSQWLGRPVQAVAQGERWLRAAASPWDLTRGLQMRKRLERGRLAWWQAPRWRAAQRAAALLAGVNLLGLNAWAWVDHQQLQAAQAGNRNHRIVGRGQNAGRYPQTGQTRTGHRIAAEVGFFIRPVGVLADQPLGQAAHVAVQDVVAEGVRVRKQRALAAQAPAPPAPAIITSIPRALAPSAYENNKSGVR